MTHPSPSASPDVPRDADEGTVLKQMAADGESEASITVDAPPPSPQSRGSYRVHWLCFFLLGTLNNLTYVVVNSAAKSIAQGFHKEDLIGAIVWCNVGFGILIRFANAFWWSHVSYTRRILGCVILCAGGCVLVGVSPSFWVSLVGVLSVGCFSSLGESLLLGFLKDFPPELMGAWSSGTGMAGVAGTMLYLLMHSVIKLSNTTIFLSQAPLVLIYFAAYRHLAGARRVILSQRAESLNERELLDEAAADRVDGATHTRRISGADSALGEREGSDGSSKSLRLLEHERSPRAGLNVQSSPESTTTGRGSVASPPSDGSGVSDKSALLTSRSRGSSGEKLAHSTSHTRVDVSPHSFQSADELDISPSASPTPDDLDVAHEDGWVRLRRVLRVIASPALQLAAVYFFEYVVSVGWASKSNPKPNKSDWWAANAYEVLAFLYQFGVLIARSSIPFFIIRRISVLTTLQGLNFVLWGFHAFFLFLPLWLQFVSMVYCGLLGGFMYVSVFYLLLSDSDSLSAADRELGINLTSIAVNFGIVTSSVFELILFNTALKD